MSFDPIPGNRSETAYDFAPTQVEAIFRATAYHRKDFDLAVIWFPPREHAEVVGSISSAFREPTAALGRLDQLPLELLHDICLRLDMVSLFRLRQTNVRGRQVVSSLSEYKILTTSALNCFRALFRTGAAPRITLTSFYQRLCEQHCSDCEDGYGDLVNLLTWTRLCSFCVRKRRVSYRNRMVEITNTDMRYLSEDMENIMENIPKLKAIPGFYTMEEWPCHGRLVATAESVDRAYEQIFTSSILSMMTECWRDSKARWMSCCALPTYDPQTKQFQNGISCAGCQIAFEKLTVEDGGNTDEIEGALDVRDMVYSKDGFLRHFQWCAQAQMLWKSSEYGAIESAKFPYTCKVGGFFMPRE